MQYSSGMKAAILRRVLPPNEEAVSEVSSETGVHQSTIRRWKAASASGMIAIGDGEVRPRDRSPGEKLSLLLESRNVETDRHGEWLRSHGLHTEHLPLWEQELREIVTDKEKKQRQELADLKRKNKQLQKELDRKDKALAETAALLARKKKAEAIWGDNEDD